MSTPLKNSEIKSSSHFTGNHIKCRKLQYTKPVINFIIPLFYLASEKKKSLEVKKGIFMISFLLCTVHIQ